LGATGERTDLNRGKLPSSYQVTLDGLPEGDGDTTLASRRTPTFGNRVSRRLPESQPTPGQHPGHDDIEFANVPSDAKRRSAWRIPTAVAPNPPAAAPRSTDMYRRLLVFLLPALPVVLAGCGKGKY
jgi:hypothetical protein